MKIEYECEGCGRSIEAEVTGSLPGSVIVTPTPEGLLGHDSCFEMGSA